jgi:serine/threonine protein kinase
MLNNLRGVPHVLLLHGVSLQMDRGERVFIIVLEWCPVSLASLLHESGSSTSTSKSRTRSQSLSLSSNLQAGMLSQPLVSQDQVEASDGGARRRLSPKTFLGIVSQLVNGLRMLHYKGYVHLDIKPQVF